MAGVIGTVIEYVLLAFFFYWVALAFVHAIYHGSRRDIFGAGVLLFISAVPLAHNLWPIVQKHILPLSFVDIVFRAVGILFLLALLGCAINVLLWMTDPKSSICELLCPPSRHRRR